MDFLTLEYFKTHIQDKDLKMILETNELDDENVILNYCESSAIARVKYALTGRYDVDVIFDADNPNPGGYPQVARWVGCLTLYYLYERIPDTLVPDRVVKNYDDVEFMLLEIADGKKGTTLPRLKDPGTESPITKFSWGSYPQRTH